MRGTGRGFGGTVEVGVLTGARHPYRALSERPKVDWFSPVRLTRRARRREVNAVRKATAQVEGRRHSVEVKDIVVIAGIVMALVAIGWIGSSNTRPATPDEVASIIAETAAAAAVLAEGKKPVYLTPEVKSVITPNTSESFRGDAPIVAGPTGFTFPGTNYFKGVVVTTEVGKTRAEDKTTFSCAK
jgi:hypothetical protein